MTMSNIINGTENKYMMVSSSLPAYEMAVDSFHRQLVV
jgi:hypothetical protein